VEETIGEIFYAYGGSNDLREVTGYWSRKGGEIIEKFN